jgi:DNA repair exonuclease SbcCD nuclease subunit
MTIAIITDNHFGARNDSVSFLDFYQKFYDGTFFPTLIENNITTVLMLGDTFDRRKYVNFLTLRRSKEMFFDRLEELGIQVHMLAGNHDTYFKNSDLVNSVDLLLKQYSNVHVIDTPQTIIVEDQPICMIPWICADNHKECLEEIKNTPATICMGHFEIAGFAMYKGMSSEGLERSIFSKFNNTFSGHYHHRSSADGIFYLGNPYQLTWSDYEDVRGFHLYDVKNYELEFIPNPNDMFFKIIYNDINFKGYLPKRLDDLSLYSSKYVKVVVLNKNNPYLFDKFMEKLYNVNPTDVTIVEDIIDLTETGNDDIITQSEDTLTILNKFVDAVQEDNIDNNRLKGILHEIYVEALNSERI